MLNDNQEEFNKVLESQGLHLTQANHHSAQKALSSIMSLVCRWPPFDFASHNKYSYQKIRSDQIMKIVYMDKTAMKQTKSDIFIVPTDDERLKIVLIPLEALSSSAAAISIQSIT